MLVKSSLLFDEQLIDVHHIIFVLVVGFGFAILGSYFSVEVGCPVLGPNVFIHLPASMSGELHDQQPLHNIDLDVGEVEHIVEQHLNNLQVLFVQLYSLVHELRCFLE